MHEDATDAINIMVYSSRPSSEGPGAQWDIVHREDATLVSSYLLEKYGPFADGSHPIHAQKYFLTDQDIETLRHRGARIYRIDQYVGDAIFILAGCVYQAG